MGLVSGMNTYLVRRSIYCSMLHFRLAIQLPSGRVSIKKIYHFMKSYRRVCSENPGVHFYIQFSSPHLSRVSFEQLPFPSTRA